MKKIIKIISILSVLIVSNNLNAIPLGPTPLKPCNYKVCAVHDKTYEVILGQDACSQELPKGFQSTVSHGHINAHDPECFSFRCTAQSPVPINN